MPTVKFEGIEEYSAFLQGLGRKAPKIINSALFDGAGILADAVREEIDGIQVDKAFPKEAKDGLKKGLGISHFWSESGSTVTKIGFDGYNDRRTKRWPKGQPNAMIARSLTRGQSWLPANRFIQRALKKARNSCVNAIKQRFDTELENYNNNNNNNNK